MIKNKLFTIASAVLLAGAIAVGGTLAYYSAEVKATNVVTMGNVNISLVGDPLTMKAVMPGDVIESSIAVKGTGEQPVYVRVKLEKGWVATDGATAGFVPNPGYIEIGPLGDGWYYGDDDYYYYNKPLDAEEVTAALYQEIFISTKINKQYVGMTAQTEVKAEGIQADNVSDFIAPNAQGMITTWNGLTVGN